MEQETREGARARAHTHTHTHVCGSNFAERRAAHSKRGLGAVRSCVRRLQLHTAGDAAPALERALRVCCQRCRVQREPRAKSEHRAWFEVVRQFEVRTVTGSSSPRRYCRPLPLVIIQLSPHCHSDGAVMDGDASTELGHTELTCSTAVVSSLAHQVAPGQSPPWPWWRDAQARPSGLGCSDQLI